MVERLAPRLSNVPLELLYDMDAVARSLSAISKFLIVVEKLNLFNEEFGMTASLPLFSTSKVKVLLLGPGCVIRS